MPPKSTKTNPAPQVAPQAGLHSRRTKPVTNRYGRVTGTTTFTQDPSPNEEYFSEDGDFEEEPEEVEYDDVAVDDPFATWDSEGYSLTYAGAHDPEGRDSHGFTRAQNEAWEASQQEHVAFLQQQELAYGYDADGYDTHGRDPQGFTRQQNERFLQTLGRVHRFDAEGYDAQGLDVDGRSKRENTETTRRVYEEAAVRTSPRQPAHGSLRPSSSLGPQPRNTPALRSRDATPRDINNSTQRQLFGSGHGDRGAPPTVAPRPHNADPGDPLAASDLRTRLQASVELSSECDRQARAIRERLATPGNNDNDNRQNGLMNRLRSYEQQLAAADAATVRLSAQLQALHTVPRPKRGPDDAPGGTGRGHANRDTRLASWAGTDVTGTTQRLLERHYRPHRDDDVVSISSDDTKGSQGRSKFRTLPPVPENVSAYLHRYTQPAQQKAMHAKANAPFMEVASIIRSSNGMRYGVHAQHDEVVRFLSNPDAFTAGVIQLRERCLALVNAEAKLYGRIRLHAARMVHDDPTTWDFPVEEIEQLHRFYSDLITCFVVHQRRMNAGENPPLSIALVYAILTTNPINWAALAKAHDPLKTNTWLHERTGQDLWRPFDAWTVTDALVSVGNTRDVRPPPGGRGGGGAPRRDDRRERRDDRRERSPPPTKPTSAAPTTPGTPAGISTDAPRPTSRPPLAPGQCANCLALNAGHNGKDCPQPCRKGGCRDAVPHPRNTCTK